MKIIDWYILKKFLSTFIFVVLILVAIIVMIDLTEKNDDFIEHNLTFGPLRIITSPLYPSLLISSPPSPFSLPLFL